jgi:enoyl-CoA hydratase/carnithine racemase
VFTGKKDKFCVGADNKEFRQIDKEGVSNGEEISFYP